MLSPCVLVNLVLTENGPKRPLGPSQSTLVLFVFLTPNPCTEPDVELRRFVQQEHHFHVGAFPLPNLCRDLRRVVRLVLVPSRLVPRPILTEAGFDQVSRTPDSPRDA